MKREELDKILARQFDPATPIKVTLPKLGFELSFRRLPPQDQKRAMLYAAHEDYEETRVRAVIAAIRYASIDEEGDPLFRSFEEAAKFLGALDIDDFQAIAEKLQEIGVAEGDQDEDEGVKANGSKKTGRKKNPAQPADVEDVDLAKNS